MKFNTFKEGLMLGWCLGVITICLVLLLAGCNQKFYNGTTKRVPVTR